MKYRVRLDLPLNQEADAEALMEFAKNLKASSINEGENNEEIAFCDYEICGHDEGLPCQKIERVEVRNLDASRLSADS